MIEFRGVGKTYRPLFGRAVRAVDDVSLDVRAGEVLGLAGPNGAGKSTLIALMLGYLPPTDGEVRLGGLAPRAYIERNGIGYLSELMAVPPRWKTETALRRYATLAGIPAGELESRVEAAIQLLGLEEHRAKRVKALSKGNLQRLGLAQAMLRDERILVLDEPTHGLDPVWTQRFRDIVGALRHPDRAIFIASHNLDELQRLADRVAIIDHGTIQRVVDTGHVASAAGATRFRISIAAGAEQLAAAFPDATPLGRGEFEVEVADLEALNRALATLIASGALVAAVTPSHSSLERQFREAVGAPS